MGVSFVTKVNKVCISQNFDPCKGSQPAQGFIYKSVTWMR